MYELYEHSYKSQDEGEQVRLPGMSFNLDWTGIIIRQSKLMTENDSVVYQEVGKGRVRFMLGERNGYSSWVAHPAMTEEQIECFMRIYSGRSFRIGTRLYNA